MLLSYQQWQMWIHKNQNPWDALCATVTLSIINITQFTPEFIYTITYLCIVFSAVGWIWSQGWWSKYHSIKLILIIEDSHYAPIRLVEGLSGRGCLKLTRDSWIIDTGTYLINWAGLSSVNKQPPESEHAHLNAADLYGENVAWIDHSKTHFRSIKATDKWDCSGWKLNYSIYIPTYLDNFDLNVQSLQTPDWGRRRTRTASSLLLQKLKFDEQTIKVLILQKPADHLLPFIFGCL